MKSNQIAAELSAIADVFSTMEPDYSGVIESQAGEVGAADEPVSSLEMMQWDAEEELHRERGRYVRPARVAKPSAARDR